jgi:hypothetical protein
MFTASGRSTVASSVCHWNSLSNAAWSPLGSWVGWWQPEMITDLITWFIS